MEKRSLLEAHSIAATNIIASTDNFRRRNLFILRGNIAKDQLEISIRELIRSVQKALKTSSYKKLHRIKCRCTKENWKIILKVAKSREQFKTTRIECKGEQSLC